MCAATKNKRLHAKNVAAVSVWKSETVLTIFIFCVKIYIIICVKKWERNHAVMNKQEKITKTTGQILKENLCTLFNLLNLLIAIALACVHAWSNLFFILIIALNTMIGIVQELKAKRLVEKGSLSHTNPRLKLSRMVWMFTCAKSSFITNLSNENTSALMPVVSKAASA